jgi:hypothetical protein
MISIVHLYVVLVKARTIKIKSTNAFLGFSFDLMIERLRRLNSVLKLIKTV